MAEQKTPTVREIAHAMLTNSVAENKQAIGRLNTIVSQGSNASEAVKAAMMILDLGGAESDEEALEVMREFAFHESPTLSEYTRRLIRPIAANALAGLSHEVDPEASAAVALFRHRHAALLALQATGKATPDDLQLLRMLEMAFTVN